MEVRGKHLLDQCGSQTAALFEFEWDCMKSLAESHGIAAEDNPFHPYVGIHMPHQDAQCLAQSMSWLQHLDRSPPEPPLEESIPEPPPAPFPGPLPGPRRGYLAWRFGRPSIPLPFRFVE